MHLYLNECTSKYNVSETEYAHYIHVAIDYLVAGITLSCSCTVSYIADFMTAVTYESCNK